jgi:hypothetical protein
LAVHERYRRAVIVVVTVFEDAAVHPRHLAPVARGQSVPQLVVK